MTQIAQQRKVFAEIQGRVCELLGWNMEMYSRFMEKTAKQYLQHYIPQDPEGIDLLVASKFFWAWWRINWYKRDAKFAFEHGVHELKYREDRALIYCEMHEPATLAKHIYPNGKVLHESYQIMIGLVIDHCKEEGI